MHNALAVFATIFLCASSTSAFYVPQIHLFSASKPAHHEISNKCTFTLWHKQMIAASEKTNYFQMFEIQDHTNDITIDIAALRPAASHNSYTKISSNDVFMVKGLLDDKSLIIGTSCLNSDKLYFDFDGTVFTSDGSRDSEDAWCDTGAWDNEESYDTGSRERKLQCAFTCGKIEKEEKADCSNDELR